MKLLDKLIGPPPEHMAAPEPVCLSAKILRWVLSVVLFLAVMVLIFIIGM